MSRPERHRGQGVAGLSELARLLSQRDWAVLTAVADHRFCTTRQVELCSFTPTPRLLLLPAAAAGC